MKKGGHQRGETGQAKRASLREKNMSEGKVSRGGPGKSWFYSKSGQS